MPSVRTIVIGFATVLATAGPFQLSARTPASAISVLFLGNSLTRVNDLPTVLKRFAAGSPLHAEITVRAITPGGALFYNHWQNGDAVRMLHEQRPNVLILQGQSTEPLSTPPNFTYYAGLFKSEADRVGAATVLLSTWARPAGDPYYNDPTSGGSPPEMQKRLNAAYASLAGKLGVRLAPAGLAWERAHLDAPGIELLDGTQHPSPAGTYLAAAMLFRVIFEPSEASSSYYGGLAKDTALSLQRIAAAIPLTLAP